MFDLFRSRQKATKILLGAILMVVAVSMVTYLIPQNPLTDDPNLAQSVLAEVGDEKITQVEVTNALDRMVSANQIPRDAAESYFPQFVDSVIQERAAAAQFSKLGLTATDDEVLAGFVTVFPQLFDKGKLISTDQLNQVLASQNMTMQQAVDTMRKQILMKKLQNFAYASVVVTPQEVDQALISKHRTTKIDYVAFAPAKFRAKVNPTTEELKKEYEKNKTAYTIPEKRTFDLILADRGKLEQSIEVSDQQIRAAYAQSMDNFRTPERVRARHILVMTQGKPDSEKGALMKRAQDLLKQVKSGGDFAELAKKNSDDPGSGTNGGDLNFFVRGQMVKEFENFAFSANVNQISDVVTTQFGYHIIQVTAKEPAKVKPLEEVKESIAKQLKADTVTEKMQQLIEQARTALLKPGTTALAAAKQTGLEATNFSNIDAGAAVGVLPPSAELDAALGSLKPEGVSDVVVLGSDKMAVVRLIGRQPSRLAGFDEVVDKVRNGYLAVRTAQLSQEAAEEAAKKAKEAGDLGAAARAYGLEVSHSNDVTVTDTVEGLGVAGVLLDAFSKPVGTIVGPTQVQGQTVVYKIIAQNTPDPATFAYERDSAYQELKQTKARGAFDLLQDSLLEDLRSSGKVKIYQDRVQRVAGTYRAR